MVSAEAIRNDLIKGTPTGWARAGEPTEIPDRQGREGVLDSAARWRRFAPLLAGLFAAELPDGLIESPLTPIPRLVTRHAHALAPARLSERVFIKADHALPLAGSIKARGGLYAVLCIAERAAMSAGLLRPGDDYAALAAPTAREFLATQQVIVGSTGNLGFAVGLAARALGFQAQVHMSHDAKEWKKQRLRALGVSVIEHRSDYTSAVTAARSTATSGPRSCCTTPWRRPRRRTPCSRCWCRRTTCSRLWKSAMPAANAFRIWCAIREPRTGWHRSRGRALRPEAIRETAETGGAVAVHLGQRLGLDAHPHVHQSAAHRGAVAGVEILSGPAATPWPC